MGMVSTYSKGMDHGLEPKVDLFGANNLGHILTNVSHHCLLEPRSHSTYARVIRFKNGNLDAFLSEESLLLGEVEGRMVRRGVPGYSQSSVLGTLVVRPLPVGQERDLISRHDGRSNKLLRGLVTPLSHNMGVGGDGGKEACPSAGIIQIKFTGISQNTSPQRTL